MNGVERIAAERKRQIETENWTPQHDFDEHGDMVLAIAAASYVLDLAGVFGDHHESWKQIYKECGEKVWIFDEEGFKPTHDDPIRQLTKAGALIAAEIDRLIANK